MVGSPRKKGKGKVKKKKPNEDDVMHNVDKAFYELQIIDLNRKLARQRSRCTELEETVTQLDTKLGKANEDHGDIICYLKRNLTERNTEVADLQTQITSLTEANKVLQENHEVEMEKCRDEYTAMQEQLMSKVKMLTGQLNALDDYRMHREELLGKFEEVQNELDAQELKFRRQIYEMEKKTVLGKANLKREMEEKMYDLATKYQEANQIRIAATSQRIVRENIALNNEMNTLITSTTDLDYENLAIKQQFKKVLADYRVLEENHKKTLHHFSLQTGVIRELTTVNQNQKEIMDKYEIELQRGLEDRRILKELRTNEDVFINKIKELETRLNAARYSQRELKTLLSGEMKFRHHLEILIGDTQLLIKSALFEHPDLKQKVDIPGEENIFISILDMLTFTKADILPPTPYGTVSSVSTKPGGSEQALPENQAVVERKPPIKKVNVMTYLGASFEDFLKQQDDGKSDSLKTALSEKTVSNTIAVSCSEESPVTLSSEEQTSSSFLELVDSKELDPKAPTEYEDDQEEEESIEEESIEEEKMDKEKLDDDIDEP